MMENPAWANLVASDVMATDVVVVSPTLSVAGAARLLAERGISGVPVIAEDSGALIGVVTESDVLRRLFGETAAATGLFARLFGDHNQQAADFSKTHGRTVADVMTKIPLIVAREDTPVADIAAMLSQNDIRRVPVVRGEALVGIVSRADLLRTVLAETATAKTTSDRDCEHDIRQRLKREAFAADFYGSVSVSNGVAIWEGYVPSDEVRRAVRVLSEAVPGIVSVDDRMVDVPPFVTPYPMPAGY